MGLLMVAAMLLGGTVAAQPAAAASTYVWSTNGSSSVPMYFAPNTQYSNVKVWMPNGTRFNMDCWLDNAGHRWFFGQEFTQGAWGYVTAGPVRNQTRVPHC